MGLLKQRGGQRLPEPEIMAFFVQVRCTGLEICACHVYGLGETAFGHNCMHEIKGCFVWAATKLCMRFVAVPVMLCK
jgi:hypothetical protein